MTTKTIFRAALLLSTFGVVGIPASQAAQPAVAPKLVAVDRAALPTAAQVQAWLDRRDRAGPAYTGEIGRAHV